MDSVTDPLDTSDEWKPETHLIIEETEAEVGVKKKNSRTRGSGKSLDVCGNE